MGALAFVAFFYRDRVVRKHEKYQVESVNDIDSGKPSVVVVPPSVSATESLSSLFWDETQWSNVGGDHGPNVPLCESTISSSEITEPTQPMSHRSATNMKSPPPKSCRSDEAISRTPATTFCSKKTTAAINKQVSKVPFSLPYPSSFKQTLALEQHLNPQIQPAAQPKPAPAKDNATTNIAAVPKKDTATVLPISAMNSEVPVRTPQPINHCQPSLPTTRAGAGSDWLEAIDRALFDYSVACKSDPCHGVSDY